MEPSKLGGSIEDLVDFQKSRVTKNKFTQNFAKSFTVTAYSRDHLSHAMQ